MSTVHGVRNIGVRERILQTASDLFYVEGVRAVGVNRIIEEAEVAKSSFYRHFPTKEHLVLAYLDEMDTLWRAALRAAAGPDRTASAKPLAEMFAALLWDGHPEDYRGAAFLKVSAEASPGSAVQVRIAEHRAGVMEWIRGLSCQAGAANPGELASKLVLLLEGALALGMVALDPDTPRLAQAAAREIIQEAIVQAAPTGLGGRPLPAAPDQWDGEHQGGPV